MPVRSGLVGTPYCFFFFLKSVAGLPPRMPMLMPMPVRSSLVATPFCPFFFCLKGEAAYHHPYAYAYAHAHAQPRALWVGGLSLLFFFFFLLEEGGGLTRAHAL